MSDAHAVAEAVYVADVGGHTRHRVKNPRVRRRLAFAGFLAFFPVPALTGARDRFGGPRHEPNHDYAGWTATFTLPIAAYLLVTGVLLGRNRLHDPLDARLGRSLARLVLRGGGGRRRRRSSPYMRRLDLYEVVDIRTTDTTTSLGAAGRRGVVLSFSIPDYIDVGEADVDYSVDVEGTNHVLNRRDLTPAGERLRREDL